MSVAVALPPAHAPNGGDVEMSEAPSGPRFTTGMILPPPEIKTVADRTAIAVARSQFPAQFEAKIRQNQVNDPKFSFLNPNDPYHGYYRHRVERIAAGDDSDIAPGAAAPSKDATGSGAVTPAPQTSRGKPFPAPEFMLDTPHLSAADIDTIKLTALFTARRGRTFLATLSQREGRNYQFDFLRPTHTLFGYFNRLVEQYTKVILPPKETLEQLSHQATPDGKWKLLAETREHAEYERQRRDREKKREDDLEAERKAFAEIDWHDYVVVQTIEFTAADATSDLPVPMSIGEMENMTLAQKNMALMITETAVDDADALQASRDGTPVQAPAGLAAVQPGTAMELEDAEARQRQRMEEEERARELERAKQQTSMLDAAGPMKIRDNYQPKLGRKGAAAAMTTCQICGQQVPTDEIQEHMRIELLDPKWKLQRNMLEARKAQASELQKGADVSAAFKKLARTRVDIFGDEEDEAARDRERHEQEAAAKQREKNVWDGHTASKTSTMEKYQSSVNFDEQIAAIHRAKGLTESQSIGPGIGPAAAPPPMLPAHPGIPQNPAHVGGIAAQAAPTGMGGSLPVPPPAFGQPPPMMAPVHMGAPPGMHPARMAQMGGPPQQMAGQVRSAEDMLADDMPPAKRQRVQKLPGGQYYPEHDWVNMHPAPISLRIQLPSHPEKPEWKLDGSVITIPELPVTLLVSTLRDRIISHLGSAVSASKMRISLNDNFLTNANSLAVYNLEDEDLVALILRAK